MDTYKGVEPKDNGTFKGNAVVVHPTTPPPPPVQQKPEPPAPHPTQSNANKQK